MGSLAQSPLGRRGLALPSAMFALVAVSLLVVGLFVVTDLAARTARNRERAARAMHIAEAGLAHVLGTTRNELRRNKMNRLLRGNDSLANTVDDSLLINYLAVPIGDWIPASGKAYGTGVNGGTYFVRLLDDPDDPIADPLVDGNSRIVARCRGVTNDGAVAELDAVIAATPMPGIATEGNLAIPGNPSILGGCGSAHANGNLAIGGTTVVAEYVSATGTVSGDADLPDGQPAPEYNNQPAVDIPALNPMDHCGTADYRLTSTGFVIVVATGQSFDARSTPQFGWKQSSGPPEVKWDLSGDLSVDGTVCAEGNVVVSGNTGSAATPRKMSIIASGSIQVSGNPYLLPENDDNIMFLAGGDLDISGNPAVGIDNFSGLMYAGSQCQISGNPTLNGQVLCDNKPNPAGATEFATQNSISGNPTITFDCDWNIFNRRRVLYWYPRIGN